MPRDYRVYLDDILEAAGRIRRYIDSIVISTEAIGPLPDEEKSPLLRQQEGAGGGH